MNPIENLREVESWLNSEIEYETGGSQLALIMARNSVNSAIQLVEKYQDEDYNPK